MYARTIGIAVDHRRSNRSKESLARNVERLKEYKANFIVFPKRNGAITVGDSSKAKKSAATQLGGNIMLPYGKKADTIEMQVITAEIRDEGKLYLHPDETCK